MKIGILSMVGKSKEYHYREKRDTVYGKLKIKLKELKPDATNKSVKS